MRNGLPSKDDLRIALVPQNDQIERDTVGAPVRLMSAFGILLMACWRPAWVGNCRNSYPRGASVSPYRVPESGQAAIGQILSIGPRPTKDRFGSESSDTIDRYQAFGFIH